MRWTGDVSAGEWLAARLDPSFAGSLDSVVPRGFATYTRVFHPATRDRPVGERWPPAGASDRAWRTFARALPEIDVERATWGEAARALGTTMHPLAQWRRIVRDAEDPRDREGWRWSPPATGRLELDLVSALSQDLSSATGTPESVFAAVWQGWGGLVGGLGFAPSEAWLTRTTDDADADPHHAEMLAGILPNVLENGYRTPTWRPGVLSDEISRGPRLRLPQRDHVLFHGRLTDLTGSLPWAAPGEAFPPSPSLVWPADRAWVVVTEVDWDSTIVAGPASAAALLSDDPRLETLPIPRDADLRWDADEVNR